MKKPFRTPYEKKKKNDRLKPSTFFKRFFLNVFFFFKFLPSPPPSRPLPKKNRRRATGHHSTGQFLLEGHALAETQQGRKGLLVVLIGMLVPRNSDGCFCVFFFGCCFYFVFVCFFGCCFYFVFVCFFWLLYVVVIIESCFLLRFSISLVFPGISFHIFLL